MDAPPTLATLPAEMQKAIADALHYEDVLSFRQVSRNLRAASEDEFLTLYFGERHNIYSRSGLTRLAELTSQTHLIKKLWYIRLLVIDPSMLAPDLSTYLEDTSTDDSDDDTPVDTYYESERNRLQLVWRGEMTDLTKDDLDVHLLALCMHNIRSSGATVDFTIIGAYGNDVAPTMASGAQDMMNTLGLDEARISKRQKVFRGDCSKPTNSLLRAAARTGFAFNHLELGEDYNRGSFRPDALKGLSSLDIQKIGHSLQSLSSLMMGFSSSDAWLFVENNFGLGALLASASNITSLFLCQEAEDAFSSDAIWEPNPLGWLSEAFAKHRLRHLRLGGFSARPDQFTKMLQGHHQTLRLVELLGVQIQQEQCWSTVLEVILVDLELDVINLSGLMRAKTEPEEEVVFDNPQSRLSLDDPEAINESLAQMLKEGVKYRVIEY